MLINIFPFKDSINSILLRLYLEGRSQLHTSKFEY